LTPGPPPPTRRTFGLLALGFAAFIVYGSWVPLNFRARPPAAAIDAFTTAMIERAAVDSRSDGVANVLIAVPLGFTLLAVVRADRPGRGRDIVVGAALLPACVGLAVGVEFGQVFLPSRTCSGSDVWCQGLGAALGMGAWVVAGRPLTGQARAVWGRTRDGGVAGRVLLAYLGLLAVVQVLPLDLSPSPKDLYKKLRDEVRVVPFGEFRGADENRAWAAGAKEIKLAGLFAPAGLLAAALPGRFWVGFPRAAVAAAGLAVGMEAIQLVVQSRSPGATDVVVGTAGALIGWGVGRRGRAGVFGVAWAAALVVAYWEPFDFRAPAAAFDWTPGMPFESGNPLFAFEEMLTKLVLFGLVGAAVGGRRPVLAAGVGLGLAAAIEAGQCFLHSHTPGVTDVLLGGGGAFAGAWVAGRVAGRDSTRPAGVY